MGEKTDKAVGAAVDVAVDAAAKFLGNAIDWIFTKDNNTKGHWEEKMNVNNDYLCIISPSFWF